MKVMGYEISNEQMYFGSYDNVYPVLVSMADILWGDSHFMHISSCKDMYQDIFIGRCMKEMTVSEIEKMIYDKYEWLQADSSRFPEAVAEAIAYIDDNEPDGGFLNETAPEEKNRTYDILREGKGHLSALVERMILWIMGDSIREIGVRSNVARY